ncbi:hypothetical protein HPB49_015410 [Dermacentor silvarum]|uniref:Uncharacterized protein n=1 Tax=Dermacentor silvarum TaxID=543639 RepID=A0ACB8E186_DERSI|nr:hypothetical protein HPB49_015410 [Dermacentor silvarum]
MSGEACSCDSKWADSESWRRRRHRPLRDTSVAVFMRLSATFAVACLLLHTAGRVSAQLVPGMYTFFSVVVGIVCPDTVDLVGRVDLGLLPPGVEVRPGICEQRPAWLDADGTPMFLGPDTAYGISRGANLSVSTAEAFPCACRWLARISLLIFISG